MLPVCAEDKRAHGENPQVARPLSQQICQSAYTFARFRYEEALQDISDQVLQEVSRTLSQLGYPAFTSEKCTSLKGQIRSIADKGNAVRNIISEFLSLCLPQR